MTTNINRLDRLPDIFFRPLGAIMSPFEDPVGLERPLVRDGSRWQEWIDFAVSAYNGVLMWASRATISWGYQDMWFPRNWSEPSKFNMYRTGYHILYPKEDVIRQADNFYRVMPEIDVIPRVIDLEVGHEASYNQIADTTWDFSNVILQRDGIRPIIYSRYLLINNWLAGWTEEMLNAHKWWLAQYLWDRTREHLGPPTLPKRVRRENVILHQTADKKAGFPGEVQSRSVDYDRWLLGDTADMHEYIANEWGDGVEPTPPPVDEGIVLRVTAPTWNVREEPTTNSTDVGDVHVGDLLTVEGNFYGNDAWAKIVDGEFSGKYIAISWQGQRSAEPV